jgi:hypothetical protein
MPMRATSGSLVEEGVKAFMLRAPNKKPANRRGWIKENPPIGGFFIGQPAESLQLGFLVHHMLASLGIELADLHFLGHGLFVLGGGVEVAGARSGLQLDLFASAFSHDFAPYTALLD